MLRISSECLALGIFALLIVICTVSNSARYRFKFSVFIIFNGLLSILFLPLLLLGPKDGRNGLIPGWLITHMLELLGLKFIVKGKENVVKGTGAVILINHQSALDFGVLTKLWWVIDKCVVIIKKEVLKYTGPFGLAAYLLGTRFVDRSNAEKARDTVNSTIDAIKTRGMKIIIFPEGTRHSGYTLRPFKKGAFHLAISGQVPIQPIVVSRYYFLNSNKKYFGSGHSYIHILPAISTVGLTKEDIDSLAIKTRELMDTEFKRLSDEALNF